MKIILKSCHSQPKIINKVPLLIRMDEASLRGKKIRSQELLDAIS